jgi:FkbM family methyltransferase
MKRLLKPIIEKLPFLASTYRFVRDYHPVTKRPEETSLGFKLIGDSSMLSGQYEPEETKLVKKLLPKVDVLINIGANIGYYTCMAMSLDTKVIAFEPMFSNLRYLFKNIEANWNDSDVEIFPIALGNTIGITHIFGGSVEASIIKGWGNTPEHYVSIVPISTLDTVLGNRFNNSEQIFILVDIEGAEQYMLEGATFFLSRSPKPIWMLEILIEDHQPRGTTINPNLLATFDMFWENGYEAFIANSSLRLVGRNEIENMTRTGVNTLQWENLLFIEKNRKSYYLT